MKKSINSIKFTLLLLASIAMLALAGCVTDNPDAHKVTNPDGTSRFVSNTPSLDGTFAPANQFVADLSSISNALSYAHQANQTSAPINPYSPVVELGLGILGALVTGASSVYAKIKSSQADAANAQTAIHAQTISTLSTGIVAAGPTAVAKVLEVASNSSSQDLATISAHINDATS